MNRTVYIILGAILVVLLLAVWIYLLFFNPATPQDSDLQTDTYTNLEFDVDGQPINPEDANNNPGNTNNDGFDFTANALNNPLRQLTTKHVAGYSEVTSGSSSPEVYFIESGVGHVYAINLETGEENRISATTIADTQNAEISQDGMYIAIQAGDSRITKTLVGTIDVTNQKIDVVDLNEQVTDIFITDENKLLYSVETTNSLIAKVYDFKTKVTKTLFTVPFREAIITWGRLSTDIHYVYPKTSSELEGFIYKYEKGNLSRLPIYGYGVSGIGSNEHVLYGARSEANYNSFIHKLTTHVDLSLIESVFPQKCVFSATTESFICGHDEGTRKTSASLDNWLQGTVSFSDSLWEIFPEEASSVELIDMESVSGRKIDVINISIGSSANNVYFKNKNDSTLWVYSFEIPNNVIINDTI